MPTEPLHVHISEDDILIDGEPMPWWVRADVQVELFPQDHEGGDNGGVVWVGIPAHDITVDPKASFVTVQQQSGCIHAGSTDHESECRSAEQQLARWRSTHVRA